MKAAFLAVAVVVTAGTTLYFATGFATGFPTEVHAAKARAPRVSTGKASASVAAVSTPSPTLPSKSFSLPLFFEPNQGQTDPQVKFLARGKGYGLFLTADEAVLQLQRSAAGRQPSAVSDSAVIRMKLDGANSSATVSGAEKLPGKSNYFIGNNPSKWHANIPQFARVEYKSVYPGVNLVYYGDQGQLEYDFRVAPTADPNQIAMSFAGASAHVDRNSGDLLLSTDQGDVRFHAPRIYQQDGSTQKSVAGKFNQLADNKIGFSIGAYDHGRELVIDPVLSYSTYFGGTGIESFVNVAVDSTGLIYVAGSTTSAALPPVTAGAITPFQANLAGAQNIFIAVISPTAAANQQLLYTTYLGGSGSDFASGIAVSTAIDQFTNGIDVVVAGTTNSTDFPTSGVLSAFQAGPPTQPGFHGFVTRLNIGSTTATTVPPTALRYSTYLAGTNLTGDATDTLTGLAIDLQGDAFVTGNTTSTNDQSFGFPANPAAFQIASNAPNQFFASKINTKGSGPASMLYSTYLGGGNPQTGQAIGGGIAVDGTGNMYITGATNFLNTTGPNQEPAFPLNLAYQNCLDGASKISGCAPNPSALDAFVAKITPKAGFTLPIYCTYVGGIGDDIGIGIAVDTSNNAYITGSTTSSDWISPGTGFQTAYGGGSTDGFIAKIGNLTGSSYPLNYFTYLGGSGSDIGQAIVVDSLQAAHVVGSTSSTNFPVTTQTYQTNNAGGEDAFVASIGTSLTGVGAGDFSTYLGGSGNDFGTGIALDTVFGATYVVGTTVSPNFPLVNPLQSALSGGSQDAFVSQIGASSLLTLVPATTSPSPNPVAAGSQVAFTFNITNTGPDNASQVTFVASSLPTSGLASTPTAKVTSGTGSCGAVQGSTITCFIPTLAAGAVATVEVDMTPAITTTLTSISIAGSVTANNNPVPARCTQPSANIVDFTITASTSTPVINAGDTATFQVTFKPTSALGYNATITPSQTTTPSMVTATTPVFNPTTVTLSGTSAATSTLTIVTVARPVPTGSLFRRGSFYATLLPIGGLSLVGLGIGAGRKRRRWLAGFVLCVIAGAILLQAGCGSSSSSVTPSGGTQARIYTITISGSAGTGASHNVQVQLQVN